MALEYNLSFIRDKKKVSTIKKALSILERAYYTKREEASFFLDPFEIGVIESIAKTNDIDIVFMGANELAERKIFVANPAQMYTDEGDFLNVMTFKAQGISHPDVLGSLLSLGIDRQSIGDISVLDGKCEFVILKEEAAFVKFNLFKIKNQPVSLDYKAENKISLGESEYENEGAYVPSLRLDNLVSKFVGLSRGKSKDLIKMKLVKVDYQVVTDPSKIIGPGSMVSIRRQGRFVFDEIGGKTKKGNYHIYYRKLK